MEYNTATLSNGLRIIHLPSSSPVVYCGFGINAGTRNELDGEEGVAHFCEHTTFKGTERRRAWHIINGLETFGGDINAFTNKEDTVYYSAILKDHTAKAVDLLSDIVFHSLYPQAEIDKEIEVICDEIESYNDSPAELIYDIFENMLFEGHPLGHNVLGEASKLRKYTTETAKAFTSRYYKPENAVFFAYGDVDFRRLVNLLKRATRDLPGAQPVMGLTSTSSTLPPYRMQKRVITKGTHQAHVMMGNRAYSVHDDRRMALYLLNNILGGPAMNARLNMSLRERNGLVYTVESSMTSYSDTGVWCVYFGCDPHDVEKCERLVTKELQRVIDKPLTTTQLNAAKRQIKGQIAVACDNRESFAIDFGRCFLHYGREKDITSLFKRIDALTSSQIQKVAQEIFDPELLTRLVIK